ncbi:hypothetical protein Taro_053821 [Colocasia esculenta]|uniref:Uncharacterized protein n=1 Tax=Colocasia esculenta TaxID=4460 RepID=A0A843XM55_COLES|nr:hypothetical protein [Colocasia esculenta]
MEDIVSRFINIKKPEQALKLDYHKEQVDAERISARRTTSSVIEESLNVEDSGLSELDPLHQKLLQRLSGKERFLLVLDDVWEVDNLNPNNWNLLTAPLRSRPADTKIIMTTRSRKVSEMALRTLTHDLGFLSDEDTLELMEHLRVLDLGGVRLDRLPESIASLKHLRYLRISNVVDELPESVGSMYHLQTLDSRGVRELPNSMSNLLNLRHLILHSSDAIEYPMGIGKLTNLRTVPSFYASPKHNRAKLGELKDLNNIRGKFAIKGLENLADVNEAKKAYLDKKRNISSLSLEWDPKADSWHSDQEVLESLQPSVKLGSLKIVGFKGPSYPSWLGDGSFSRLGTIKLEHCENWTFLPPLGHLPSLRSLNIAEARAVEYIGSEFFSGGFPQLEELTLREMSNWKSWCGAQIRECPKLKKLSITRCENLESLSLINLGAVEYLYISSCPRLRCMPGHSLELSHFLCVQTIKIRRIYQVGLIDAAHFSPAAPSKDQPCLQLEDVGQREAEYILGMCSHICQLTVKRCSNLTSLPFGFSLLIRRLTITECANLTSLAWTDPSFSRLRNIKLEHCEKWISLPPLGQLPSLKSLYISEARAVEYIGTEFFSGGFPQLEELTLKYLYKWKSWCGAQKEECRRLKKLSIECCENLECLSLINLGAVVNISISRCPKLRCMPGHSLELSHLPCVQKIKIQDIYQVGLIDAVHFSPAAPLEDQPCLQLEDVGRREAEYILGMCSHICRLTVKRCSNLTSLPFGFSNMICQLTITECANLASLPWTDLITLEYLRISDCPLFRLLDAKQLPPTLQVLCIYENPHHTEQCSNGGGGERNLYLMFHNVHDASVALKFCCMNFTKIHCLDIEWDCCNNDWFNVTDAITEEVLSNFYSLCFSSKKLVFRGSENFLSKKLCSDFLHSRLSSVSLLQCSTCEILPALCKLPFLEVLYVGGASNLENVVLDSLSSYDQMTEREWQATYTSIAFPHLQKLEFHDMPVWKEWLGAKEGDFPFLWKLVLEHCPRLRALPHLPPGLKELYLEDCEELRSSTSDKLRESIIVEDDYILKNYPLLHS